MSQPQQDRWFLQEALPQLQDYLLGDELYWALGGTLPRLTPGNLLLALKRLEVLDPQSAWILRRKLDTIQTKWRSAWEKKIDHETLSRLRLWAQFLSEQVHDEGPHRAHYAASVRERVILQLLLSGKFGEESQFKPAVQPSQAETLANLDDLLRARFIPGDFVWEPVFQTAFPQEEFWFLYGSL